jgi:hypothetical protein
VNGVNKDEIHDGSSISDKESSGTRDMINLQNGMNTSSRESFLTYFFGSGNKTDRTILPDQPVPSRNGNFSRDIEDLDKLENVRVITILIRVRLIRANLT